MPEYLVSWEIEVDGATPRDAAKRALEIMRDPGSSATYFIVRENDGDDPGKMFDVDLWDEEDEDES